jgi:hypothetical protein
MTQLETNVINVGEAYNQADAALCIWEHVLECSTGKDTPLRDWFAGGEGAAQARTNCIELAPLVNYAYEVGSGDEFLLDQWAFDWDVCPVIVDEFSELCIGPGDVTIEIAKMVGLTLQQLMRKQQ